MFVLSHTEAEHRVSELAVQLKILQAELKNVQEQNNHGKDKNKTTVKIKDNHTLEQLII